MLLSEAKHTELENKNAVRAFNQNVRPLFCCKAVEVRLVLKPGLHALEASSQKGVQMLTT